MDDRPILVNGATGYVGGRLVPRLLQAGYRVRAAGRNLGKLNCRPWAADPKVETVRADVLDYPSLAAASEGCRASYWLVHSMISAKGDYADRDRRAAENMVGAAERAGLDRIVYLGGLGEEGEGLSEHLASRTEVGRIFLDGPVPATFLRAAMILGAGSASFEIMRYLVERLPVMVTPRWVHSRVQPIAIGDVLGYLIGVLDHPDAADRTLDVGGPDRVTYAELFQMYAEEAGLKRRVILPAPLFSPKLSSYWIHLVTPVPAAIARPLAQGLKNTVVVQDDRIRDMVPLDLTSCRQAIRTALDRTRQERVETCWMDAGELLPPEWPYCDDAPYTGGDVSDRGFRTVIEAEPEEVWPLIAGIGGKAGWYAGGWLWRLRGLMDRMVGGVGLGRGRRHPRELYMGDALDFWRVLAVEPPRRLLLLAEMKLPGQATLELKIMPAGPGASELRLTSRFMPRGLAGLAYWYAALPLHDLVFKSMLEKMIQRVGRPVIRPPRRFEPGSGRTCALPDR